MRQCICQICVCGRHHCEHRKHSIPYAKSKDDADKITEHKDRYRHFGYQQPELPIKPPEEANWKGDEPPVKISTTRRDYVPLPLPKKALKRSKAYKEPKGKMASDTTYKHDYKPKKSHTRSKFKGGECTKDGTMPGTLPGKIEDASTYRKSYTPKPLSRREKAKAQEGTLTELGQPFMGDTETRQCYQPHEYHKREPVRPNTGELKPEGDFEGYTTHKTDYTPKYQTPPKSCKKVSKWKPLSGEFEGVTTHAHDYKCPDQYQKLKLVIPEPSLAMFEGSFEGLSNYRRDFPAHPTSFRKLPKWHPSFHPRKVSSAPMTGHSTYRTDYEPPPEDIPPHKPKPMKNNLTIPSGSMEKLTTMMRDYRRVANPIMTKSCKPDTEYKKPQGKFSDCTTTRCDYTAKTTEKAATSKQADNLGLEEGLMEDLSTTMRDFQGIRLDCPAKYLKLYGKDALPQFKYEKTEKGHDYFRKVKKPKKPIK